MISDLLNGFKFLFKGLKLITQPGIRPFVIIPFLVNLLLFTLAIWYAGTQFAHLLDALLAELPGWLDWLRWILWPIFALAILIVVFYVFTIVANIIAAPFNGVLAERVEAHLGGEVPASEGGLLAALKDAPEAIGTELKKLGYMLMWLIPLIILSLIAMFIPGLNLLTPLLWFIFGAWMLALEYTDYTMANHQLRFTEERAILRRNRSLALGFGGGIMLMSTIPVLNFLAMPVGVAGGAALWVERLHATHRSGAA